MDEQDEPILRPIGAFGATLILATFVLGTFATMEVLARVIGTFASGGPAGARELVATHPIFGGAAQLIAASLVLFGARHFYFRGHRFAPIVGLVPVAGPTLALAAIVGASMQFPLAELANLVEYQAPVPFEEKLRVASLLAPSSFVDGLGLVLAVVAIAPIAEELIFRGLLMGGIARGSGVPVAIVISTLGFAISHVRPTAVAAAFAGGLVLAIIAYRTESILPSMVAHAASNALPVLVPARLLSIEGWNVPTEGPGHVPLVLVAPAAAITLVALVRLLQVGAPRVDAESSDDE